MSPPANYRRIFIAYGILLVALLGAFALVVSSRDWPPVVPIVGAIVIFHVWLVLGLVGLLGVYLTRYGRAVRLTCAAMLAAVFLVAAAFVWSCFTQKATVEAIWQARGGVKFAHYPSYVGFSSSGSIPPWLPYLSSIVDARVPAVEAPALADRLSTLNDLERLKLSVLDGPSAYGLAKLPKLKRLVIWFRNDPDPGLAFIGKLSQLEELEISSNYWVTDAGLEHLANLTQLKSLEIYPSKITDKGVEKLAHLRLQNLHLDGSRITDESLRGLEQMPLFFLWVRNTWVTNEGIQRLRKKIPVAEVLPPALPSAPEEAGAVAKLQSLGFSLAANENGQIIEAELMYLAGFEYFDSGETEPSAEEVCRLLSQLPELQKITISYLKASAQSMAELAKLANLEELTLLDADVEDDELLPIASFTKLRELDLLNSPITDEALTTIGKLTSLEELELMGTKIRGRGFEQLASLQKLTHLRLEGSPVENEGLEHLVKLNALEWLDLISTNVTDEGIKYLAQIPNLRSLNLTRTKITDAGLPALARAPVLQKLSLGDTEVTAAGVNKLRESSNYIILDITIW
jgi:Leucine-rich repeat (LRR) protein